MATAYTMLLMPRFRAFDLAGEPLTGGKVYIYEAGTSTAKTSYKTAGMASANTWPVVLDADGQADIWVAGPYKVVVADSSGVQQYTRDNLHGFGGQYATAPTHDEGKLLAWGADAAQLENSNLNIRAIQFPATEAVGGELPAMSDRIGSVLGFGPTGGVALYPLEALIPTMNGSEDWGSILDPVIATDDWGLEG